MPFKVRIQEARGAALTHLWVSLLACAIAGLVIFAVWFPHPYDQTSGGRHLFLLLAVTNVVCGPVLTFVLFDPVKSKIKWRVDLFLILAIQISTFVFGLNIVAKARPLFLAFEGNRFRVVHAGDFDITLMSKAQSELTNIGLGGPRLIGARLAKSTDPDFPLSVQLSMQGLHPAFRPDRWTPYHHQRGAILAELRPISMLRSGNPGNPYELNQAIVKSGLQEDQLGYLPMVDNEITDWVVLVNRVDAQPVSYVNQDGW